MSANAIERIRDALDGGVPLLYREDRMARRAKAEDALAAVEALLEAAIELLRLKDGPRDAEYAELKASAWGDLREAVARVEPGQ